MHFADTRGHQQKLKRELELLVLV